MNGKYNIQKPCKKYNLLSKGDDINYHCAACKKNVKDLSSVEIIDLANTIQHAENTCVKILPKQLNIINKLLHGSKQAAIYASAFALITNSCTRKVVPNFEEQKGKITIVEKSNDSSVIANNVIKGKLIDFTNDGLIGGSIEIQGTQIGIETDIDGSFRLEFPSDIENNTKVLFKYTGFQHLEIEIGKIRGKQIMVSLEQGILIGYIEMIQ